MEQSTDAFYKKQAMFADVLERQEMLRFYQLKGYLNRERAAEKIKAYYAQKHPSDTVPRKHVKDPETASENDLIKELRAEYEVVSYELSRKTRKKLPRTLADRLGETVTVVVEHPIGAALPDAPKTRFPVNCGYVEGFKDAGNRPQLAYVLGVDTPVERFKGTFAALIHRKDEERDLWVVCPQTARVSAEEVFRQVFFLEQDHDIRITVASEE